jgi:hypothetical protein
MDSKNVGMGEPSISFISRMRGNKGKLYEEDGKTKTRKHTSLLIWGHNPKKFNQGGETYYQATENDWRRRIKFVEELQSPIQTAEERKRIAAIILEQLGGYRFLQFTGARNLAHDADSLMFRIGRNKSKANYVKIKLEPNDTYTYTFGRIHGGKYRDLDVIEGVYSDQLERVFTDYTGLVTRFGEGGQIEYQKRQFPDGDALYYKRKNGGNWQFISKGHFDRKAKKNNTVEWTNGQLEKGRKVEMEHQETVQLLSKGIYSPEQAAEMIAKDHLKESPEYYERLEEMESNFAEGGLVSSALEGRDSGYMVSATLVGGDPMEISLSLGTDARMRLYFECSNSRLEVEVVKIMKEYGLDGYEFTNDNYSYLQFNLTDAFVSDELRNVILKLKKRFGELFFFANYSYTAQYYMPIKSRVEFKQRGFGAGSVVSFEFVAEEQSYEEKVAFAIFLDWIEMLSASIDVGEEIGRDFRLLQAGYSIITSQFNQDKKAFKLFSTIFNGFNGVFNLVHVQEESYTGDLLSFALLINGGILRWRGSGNGAIRWGYDRLGLVAEDLDASYLLWSIFKLGFYPNQPPKKHNSIAHENNIIFSKPIIVENQDEPSKSIVADYYSPQQMSNFFNVMAFFFGKNIDISSANGEASDNLDNGSLGNPEDYNNFLNCYPEVIREYEYEPAGLSAQASNIKASEAGWHLVMNDYLDTSTPDSDNDDLDNDDALTVNFSDRLKKYRPESFFVVGLILQHGDKSNEFKLRLVYDNNYTHDVRWILKLLRNFTDNSSNIEYVDDIHDPVNQSIHGREYKCNKAFVEKFLYSIVRDIKKKTGFPALGSFFRNETNINISKVIYGGGMPILSIQCNDPEFININVEGLLRAPFPQEVAESPLSEGKIKRLRKLALDLSTECIADIYKSLADYHGEEWVHYESGTNEELDVVTVQFKRKQIFESPIARRIFNKMMTSFDPIWMVKTVGLGDNADVNFNLSFGIEGFYIQDTGKRELSKAIKNSYQLNLPIWLTSDKKQKIAESPSDVLDSIVNDGFDYTYGVSLFDKRIKGGTLFTRLWSKETYMSVPIMMMIWNYLHVWFAGNLVLNPQNFKCFAEWLERNNNVLREEDCYLSELSKHDLEDTKELKFDLPEGKIDFDDDAIFTHSQGMDTTKFALMSTYLETLMVYAEIEWEDMVELIPDKLRGKNVWKVKVSGRDYGWVYRFSDFSALRMTQFTYGFSKEYRAERNRFSQAIEKFNNLEKFKKKLTGDLVSERFG